tara:strand:- start:110 stop:274 length:165 start_codon:yes stop_codon:yes gene_type:complete
LIFPFFKYLAPSHPAKTTFLGFQVNLYPHGLSHDSGAINPPQNDLNEVILIFTF